MEFAEWVVSGLDQYRLGQLPGGAAFFNTVWGRLGSDPRLPAFLNSGDPGSRAALTGLIAATLIADPGFEQQLRAAAPGAQPAQAYSAQPQQPYGAQPYQPGGPAKPNFFKTTAGVVTLILASIALVGGGLGLALGQSGGGGSSLAEALKGTWSCTGTDPSSSGSSGQGTLVIGDGTWSAGDSHGTWKQDGGTVTLTDQGEDSTATLAGVPSSTGPVNITVTNSKNTRYRVNVTGNVSAHSIKLTVAQGLATVSATCTK